ASETSGLLFRALETVAVETPARAAMSLDAQETIPPFRGANALAARLGTAGRPREGPDPVTGSGPPAGGGGGGGWGWLGPDPGRRPAPGSPRAGPWPGPPPPPAPAPGGTRPTPLRGPALPGRPAIPQAGPRPWDGRPRWRR